MGQTRQYIAVDLGAESGRVMSGTISKNKLVLREIYRFPNGPIEEDGSLRWDFNSIFSQVKTGLAKAIKRAPLEILQPPNILQNRRFLALPQVTGRAAGRVASIGIDSWGVDFGLIDHADRLIENPYHYRDSRTNGIMEKAFELMSKREIYENTGTQFMQLNTLYQLLAMSLQQPEILAGAEYLLFIADLLCYHLCGEVFAEYTLASTSQLMDMKTGQWSKKLFEKFGLPLDIMPKLIAPGTTVGKLKLQIADELKCSRIPVIAVGSHDTASAVAAVPAQNANWAYLSSGTWSLMGVEIPEAIIDDKTFKYQFTNEGGVENTIRLLKNAMGLWIVQQCRRQWHSEGADFSYAQLTEMAKKARPFVAHIQPNDSRFFHPGDMPARINKYLAGTNQAPVNDKGQMIRLILESMAFNYRWMLEKIEAITGRTIEVLHIIGGGAQNELLCQFTADAIARVVIAGPVEATAIGNIIMQAIATGQIKSLQQARALVNNSFELKKYTTIEVKLWDKEYRKIKNSFGP